ncbi:MAG: T9SS type A sorting domain-containing protein [Saprospiraceae bacterium]|nr:T9SS type A sorting domain-containing protein [Saprospiraceae bacterium]
MTNGSHGISVSGVNTSYTQRVWANAVFASNAVSGGQQSQNISETFAQATQFLNAPSLPIAGLDVTPIINMLNIPGINLSLFDSYSDFDVDFDGLWRDGSRAGAYMNNTPIWALQLILRPTVETDVISPDTQIFLKNNSISLYPCPAQNYVQIEGLLADYQLRILDINGAVHQTISSSGTLTSIDVQSLPPGIFFISILNNGNNSLHMVKMIKGN